MSTTATVSGQVIARPQDTTAALRAALDPGDQPVSPGRRIYFLFLDMPGHPVRVHSDFGEREYAGETWIGVGTLGNLSAIESTTDLRSPAISCQLSIVNNEALRAVMMLGGYQGRTAEIHLGAVARKYSELIAAQLQWAGIIDHASIASTGTGRTVSIQLTDEMSTWNTPPGGTYSHVDQIRKHPGDKGLEHVLKIQNTPVQWGQA